MKARFDPHGRYRELLAARLDRPLARAEYSLLVGHLKKCAECRQAERDYLDQRASLRSMPSPHPPRDMWARTSTALDREVARWSYRYPRFGRRRVPLGEARRRGGAPSALATAVAALGLVSAIAVLQLAPALRPSPGLQSSPAAESSIGPGVAAPAPLRPTPFSVAPQPLAVVAAGPSDLAVYETQVNQVCPTTAFDCFDEERVVRRSVMLPSKIHPQNVALSPNGDQLAFVGSDTDRDLIAVVMLLNEGGRPDTVNTFQPDDWPSPTDAVTGPVPPPTATASARASSKPASSAGPGESASAEPEPPAPTGSPDVASALPDASPAIDDTPQPPTTPETTPASGAETPLSSAPETPPVSAPETPRASALETPPPSVVPGLTILSILQDVHSAGAPPAWSRDGSILAFSAMPADGRHGPDVYVWQPGDDQAHAITSDHSSFFASWSGRRIVVSRIDETAGKADAVGVRTLVIDPQTLEERLVDGPQMWLPIVDAQRAHAIVWHGKIDRNGKLPELRQGALYVVDWAALNPFRDPAAATDATAVPDPRASPDGIVEAEATTLTPVDPARNAAADPVLDWHVRWSGDGRVVGVWEADAPNASWGQLALLAFDPGSGRLDLERPLIEKQLARRGFTLGVDRVAWVGPSEQSAGGELRIRTWGTDGVGGLRIRSLETEELVPAF